MKLSSSRYFFTLSLKSCHFFIFLLMMMILLLPSPPLVNADDGCPPADAIAPCECAINYIVEVGRVIEAVCRDRNLNDSKMNEILDVFLTTPGIQDGAQLYLNLHLNGNQITRVPTQIKLFERLRMVDLSRNSIRSIESGAFDASFPDKQNSSFPIRWLDLDHNQLTTIAPGAFKGDRLGKDLRIIIANNNLTRFESTVFQSVLEKMVLYVNERPYAGGPFINLADNPFECDCHLAWLIRDNRHLIPVIYFWEDVRCSNGTLFEDLDPTGFADCPTFVCPLGYDGYYADPLSCSSFYICSANVAYYYECPPDLVFNPETERCDAFANVVGRCGSFICPNADGYFANPLSCSSYYLCIDNEPFKMDCPPSFVFNPDKNQCDKPENVPSCN